MIHRQGGGLGFLYPDDPLWDGPESTCTIPNMPWFLKTLNTDNIELRVCGGEMKIHFCI